jgi:hypothetical protein
VTATHGFVAYPYEFWHYSRGDGLAATATADSRPAIFGTVHVARDGITTPLQRPHEPFTPSLLIALEPAPTRIFAASANAPV